MISVYPMNIPLQVLYTSDLERFSKGICVLIVVPNIRTCSRFCRTSVQASSGMMVVFVHLVGS